MRSHRPDARPLRGRDRGDASSSSTALVEAAENESRDLDDAGDGARHPRPRPASSELNEQMKPLEEAAPDRRASRASGSPQIAQVHANADGDKPTEVEYRSAGEYVLDYWQAGLGDERRRASGSSCTTAPPRTRPPPTTPACCPSRSSGRSSTSSTQPARSSPRSGRASCRPGRGRGRRVTQHTQVGRAVGGEDRAASAAR